MCVLKKLKQIVFSTIIVNFLAVENAICSIPVPVVSSVCQLVAPSMEEVKLIIQKNYNPRSVQPNSLPPPMQLGRLFYSSRLEKSLKDFNNSEGIVNESAHCSVCAVTYVYDGGTSNSGRHWIVNTLILNALFVSGAHKKKKGKGLFCKVDVGNIASPWDKNNQRLPPTMSDVFCFPSKSGFDSHSERAIISFLSNTGLQLGSRAPSLVMIHIQNMMPACLNCYHAMANASGKRKKIDNKYYFIDGQGLTDICSSSNGKDPMTIVGNDTNFCTLYNRGREEILNMTREIPVSIGVGHYIEPRLLTYEEVETNIDWIDRY